MFDGVPLSAVVVEVVSLEDESLELVVVELLVDVSLELLGVD
jgi:hypothetical protein